MAPEESYGRGPACLVGSFLGFPRHGATGRGASPRTGHAPPAPRPGTGPEAVGGARRSVRSGAGRRRAEHPRAPPASRCGAASRARRGMTAVREPSSALLRAGKRADGQTDSSPPQRAVRSACLPSEVPPQRKGRAVREQLRPPAPGALAVLTGRRESCAPSVERVYDPLLPLWHCSIKDTVFPWTYKLLIDSFRALLTKSDRTSPAK